MSDESLHRLLPQAPALEQSVLGALAIDTPRCIQLAEEMSVSADWFVSRGHAVLFSAITHLHGQKKPIEFRLLGQYLTDAGLLESAGGAPVVSDLFSWAPTSMNFQHDLEVLQEKFTRREMIRLANHFGAAAYNTEMDAVDLVDGFQIATGALPRPGAETTGHARHIRHGLMESVLGMEEAYRNRGKLQGLPSGFAKLDDMTMGFKPQQLVFIAGRPAMGKSAFLMNIAQKMAETGAGVLFFTLEMSERDQCDRFLCGTAGMPLNKVRDGYFSEAEMASRIPAAMGQLQVLPIHIDETSAISIQDVRARTRAFCRAHPETKAIILDYVQLMVSNTRRARENRALELSEISGGLKRLAKELKITVFAGAQLNRDADDGKLPKLSQFRESGALEQDCDIAILLHRPGYYDKERRESEDLDAYEARMAEAIAVVAKHRNGSVDNVPLRFIGKFTRFEDAPLEQTGVQIRTNEARQKQQRARQQEWTDHARKD